MSDTDSNLNPGANQEGGAAGSSVNIEAETLKKLLSRLDTLESQQKALQGDKDRGVHKVTKNQEELKKEFVKVRSYLETFKDPADAEWRYTVDQQLARREEQIGEPGNTPGENAPAKQNLQAVEVDIEMLRKYGVDPQGPEYLEQVKGGLVGVEAALAVLAGKPAPSPKPNQATGASGGTGGSGAPETAQQVLQAQYVSALDKAQAEQGFLTPMRLHQVQEEYRKKGLKLD
jgi:hypothetical protein